MRHFSTRQKLRVRVRERPGATRATTKTQRLTTAADFGESHPAADVRIVTWMIVSALQWPELHAQQARRKRGFGFKMELQ